MIKTKVFTVITLLLLTTIYFNSPTFADSRAENLVDSIKSVTQVKHQLRELMQPCQGGCSGYGMNIRTTQICELVGALDVKVNGKIIGAMSSGGSKLSISKTDLALMKLIASQCKPSNYQYWNFESVLHVTYQPTALAERQIKKALAIR